MSKTYLQEKRRFKMDKPITDEELQKMLENGEISKEAYDEFTNGKGGD